MKSYAVIFSYNFDNDVAVYLFDTQEEAVEYLKKSVLEEYRILTEENGFVACYHIDEDGLYGRIATSVYEKDYEPDITEVRVGSVYLPNE
jgi:hypothetical protein